MAHRRLRREEYTVGWVCALPIELAAAQEMLDEEHKDPEQHENNNNLYSLGRIGGHNVVIVCLPAGLIGHNPATVVATQLRSTFRSVRFGLMVGIGGGVPSTEVDIRLGDVVVSQPHQSYGGVVQYDLGKTTPSGFHRTGFLNSPPLILLSAVAKIQANHLRRKSKLSEHVSKLHHLPEFTHDSAGPDVLFEATYNHAGGSTCELCSLDKKIDRQPRESDNAVVHYGTIASGNQVMRDGVTRDKVSQEFGSVLCFEMEAAGLMNSFPCLVIRGICDYADSHKNKKWQAYAAGTAAACAKEILSVIPTAEVAKLSTVDEIIKEMNALDSTLNRLPYAGNAPFNSYARQHEPTCLPDTRVDILREIHEWADGQDTRYIFWLNGLAGTGKSTIARTVAYQYSERERLGASFFFSRGGGDASHAGKFVTTIAVQLANNVPSLKHYICEAIADRSNITSQSLRDQWHHLVLRPLSKLDANGCQSSYVLVVDALDECDDDKSILTILQLLAEARSLQTVLLRAFLTSRPEIPIRCGFCQIPDAEHQDFVLHSISPSITDHDIRIFLEHNLRTIRQEKSLDSGWPGEDIIRCLVRRASGLFIWAATACRFIREGKQFAVKRLGTILEGTSITITAPEKQLNEIYISVLKQSISPDYTDEEKEEFCGMLRHILGSVAVLLSPLSTLSLSKLLYVSKEDVDQILADLHAILDIPKEATRPLRLHHPSFRDFLLTRERCGDSNFWVDEKHAHQTLLASCLQLMSASLKQDICGLDSPGVLITNIERSRVEQYLPPEVQYTCLHWIRHLQKSGATLRNNNQVYRFLQEHFLHWLEALSWMQKFSKAIRGISSLESLALASRCPDLQAFVHDMKRFALYSRSAIEQAPLQVYCNALIFAPTMSIVRKQFQQRVPRWIQRLPQIQKDWDALLQTLEGHSDCVNAVAFSPDGEMLASASNDGVVELRDADSGAVLQTLKGHAGPVNAIAFSPDGKMLVSASNDKAVKLWDTNSGAVLQTLKGYAGPINATAFSPDGRVLASTSSAMAFSPDGKVLALASGDDVRLQDASSGAAVHTLQGHLYSVNAVAFSPDSKMLASASSDGTVKIWNVGSGAAIKMLGGHSSSVNGVAFSPDGAVLVSASFDSTVKLWDANSGATLQTLKGHTQSVEAVAFSPDGKVLASASSDCTIKLWDAALGAAGLQTLEGHSDCVSVAAFSPDGKVLASRSIDGTVKLWDASSGAALKTLEGSINAMVFSPDGKVLASASDDRTVKLWDSGSGAALHTLQVHSHVIAMAFSPDGKVLASASYDGTVKLWDVDSAAALLMSQGNSYVNAIAFSSDSKVLASASDYDLIRLWDTSSGAALQTLQGYSNVTAIALSPDGKVLAIASESRDNTVELRYTGTGEALHMLENHSGRISAVAFSPDGKVLASASDNTIGLWDANSGAAVHTLQGHLYSVNAVAFSPDSKMLASASIYGTVKIWNTNSGAALQTLRGLLGRAAKAICFSPDGKVLASLSDRQAIMLWDTSSGAALQKFDSYPDSVVAIAFSLDGKVLVSGSYPFTIRHWDVGSGATLHTFWDHSFATTLAFSPDGKVLASGGETVKLWDADLGSVLQTLQAPLGWVEAITFSLDGKVLASVSARGDGTVKLWDAGSGAFLQLLQGHLHVKAMSFSPDGKVLASGSDRGTIKLWDASSGATLYTLQGHSDVTAMAFSPDSKVLVSASSDGIAKLWDIGSGAALQTLEVNAVFQAFSISDGRTFLQPGNGRLHALFFPHGVAVSRPNPPHAISVNEQWVSWGNKIMLWLPPEHREPYCVAVHGSVLALGYTSGRVLIFTFSF